MEIKGDRICGLGKGKRNGGLGTESDEGIEVELGRDEFKEWIQFSMGRFKNWGRGVLGS
jgi:hypothetical protein